MTRDKRPSATASRWILALAALAVVIGSLLVLVARRGASERSSPSQKETRSRQVTGAARAATASDAPVASRRPGDRRRLAEQLRQLRLRRRAMSPPATGTPEGTVDRGSDPHREAGRGGRADRGETDPGEENDDVQWPVNREGIRGAIRARISEIKECYEGWLSEDPTLGGQVVVSFTIESGDGGAARIREAGIHGSDVEHPWLERCILVMVESLQFEPPPEGRVVVRYPFRFSPQPEPGTEPQSE